MLNKKLKLRSGVKVIVKEAQSKGIKLVIATSTSIENVKLLVETAWEINVCDLFNAVVSSEMVREKNQI